ncbi:hypothetical protein CMU19_07935 [Elizabethkingia anophelis]|nr:hypothetical protein [Elizabethkingia anophelis]
MTHNLNSVAKLDYTGMHPKLFWIKWLHKGYQFFSILCYAFFGTISYLDIIHQITNNIFSTFEEPY